MTRDPLIILYALAFLALYALAGGSYLASMSY